MRNLILVLMIILVPAAARAATGDHQWSKGWGVEGKASADKSGHVAVAGTFFSSVDFGGGTLSPVNFLGGDVYVARFDADGNHVWSQQFTPGGFGLILQAMTTAPDGSIYLAGSIGSGDIDFGGGTLTCSNEFVIACFDPDGTHRFSRVVGNGAIRDISATNNSVAFVGYTNGSVDFGGGTLTSAGDQDVVLAVLGADGTQLHASLYGGIEAQGGMSVVQDDDSGTVIAGTTAGAIDFGGGSLAVSIGAAFLAAFDGAGAHRWSNVFEGDFSPGSGILADMDLAISSANGIACAGQYLATVDFGGGPLNALGQADVFLARFASDGTLESSQSYGGNKTDTTLGVAFDAQDHLALSGNFLSDNADFGDTPLVHSGGFSSDWFLVLFDETGAHEYQASFTGNGQYYMRVDFADDGDLVLSGNGAGNTDFGGGPVASTGTFIASLEGPNPGGGSTAAPAISRLHLAQNAPNPFNPTTTISFRTTAAGPVVLEVFDAAGRRVRTLRDGNVDAGRHDVVFDGRDDQGRMLASGVYHYSLRGGGHAEARSMVLVK